MNLLKHLKRQIGWSIATFGPGQRTQGVCNHIRKELDEIEAKPEDLEEWIDVVILGFDGAHRAGYTAQEICDALQAKQKKNEQRAWPDWRNFSEGEAIEHLKPTAAEGILHSIGEVVRYDHGPTALMRITTVSPDHAGVGKHRYYGEQVYGGTVGAYHRDIQKATEEDLDTWHRIHI